MKFYLIAAVLGCALISAATGNVVADTVRLEEGPQVVKQLSPIAAEPLNEEISPQLQKILSQIPDIINEAAGDQLKDVEIVKNAGDSTDAVALPQDVALQSNREAKQLIGFIPTYMLRQAIRLDQSEIDDSLYDGSDEVEEERAIRRRKRFRRRNTRGHLKKSRRHKNINKHNQKTRWNLNTRRKSPSRGSSLRKRKVPRKKNKNKKTQNKNKTKRKPKPKPRRRN